MAGRTSSRPRAARTRKSRASSSKRGSSVKGGMASWHEPNYTLIGLVAALLIFGLIMLASASSVQGFEKFADPNFFVKRQLLYGVLIGVPVLWVMSRIDYHYWKQFAFPIIVASIILLMMVLIPGIGVELLGARRWISLGGITFQPSELVKIAFIIYLAAWLESRDKDIEDFSAGFMPFMIMMSFLVVMIAGVQSDLGTMVVIGVIGLVAYFIAGAPWKHIWTIIGIGLSGLFMLIQVLPAFFPSLQYRKTRLQVLLNPELDPLGVGYQANQALLAVGSGGILGLGLGHSRQKFNYLPEIPSDTIFAVIAEEMGFIVTAGLVVLFLAFMVQGYKVATQAPDTFGKIIAAGVTSWITFQAAVNMMAMLGLVPLTGITLPFISYGSTSLVTLLAAVGIVINISRQTR